MPTCFCISLVWILCVIAVSKAVEEDKWSIQLTELKVMMTNLDSKVTSLEAKLAGIQILEYAFKVNSLDNSLRSMDTKLNQMAQQMNTMKDSFKTSCSNAQYEQMNPRRGGERDVTNNDLMEKIEDYGMKTKSSQDVLMEMAEDETKELKAIMNISRTGFTKLYQKVENVLVIEGQMTRLSQNVRSWSPKFSQISNQMTDLAKDVEDVKTKVEWNSGKLQNITSEISVVLSQVTNRTSNSSKRVLQIADQMKDDMNELQENTAKVKTAVDTAKKLQADLSRKIEQKDINTLKRLTEELEAVEVSQLPLTSKLLTSYRDLDVLMRGSSASTFGEFTALIDAIESKQNCSGGFIPVKPSAFFTIGQSSNSLQGIPQRLFNVKNGANQKDIFDKLSYVRNTLLSIQDDARKYCSDPSAQPQKTLGAFLG